MNLKIPDHWNHRQIGNGHWWAGDSDETIAVHVQIEYTGVWSEADGETTVDAETYVAQAVELLRTIPRVGEIEIDRIPSGHVVHAVTDYDKGGKPFRSHCWYSILGRSDSALRVRLELVIQPGTADAAVVQWLCGHLRKKARAMDMSARVIDGPNARSLKDLSVDDVFGIRIPDDWAHDINERAGLRSIWCYPRGSQLGKLVIAYEHKRLPPEFAGGRDPDIANKLADLRDRDFEDDERRRLSRVRFAAPLGVIVYIVDDEKPRPYSEDDLDRLYVRHHQWFYVIAGRRYSLVAFFNMKMPLRWISRPETAETIALMDREIRALRLLQMFDR